MKNIEMIPIVVLTILKLLLRLCFIIRRQYHVLQYFIEHRSTATVFFPDDVR